MTTPSAARRPGRLRRAAASVALASAVLSSASGCIDPLAPGEFGIFRYVEDMRGAPPALALLPPLSDRVGGLLIKQGGVPRLARLKTDSRYIFQNLTILRIGFCEFQQ